MGEDRPGVRLAGPGRLKLTPTVTFRFATVTATASVVAAAILGGPLVYDGCWLLVRVLLNQASLVDKGRYAEALPELPALLASQFTSDMGILRLVFGLSYVAIPIIALVASWLVVRKDAPHLFVWAALGMFLVCLPVGMYFTADVVHVSQLAWPVLLATAVRLRGWTWIVAAGFSVVMLLLHPLAAVVLLCSVGVALLLAWSRPEGRRRLLFWAAVALLAAAVRVAIVRAGYETSLVQPSQAVPAFLSLKGRYLVAYGGAWVVGLAVIAPRFKRLPASIMIRAPWVAAAALIAIGLAMLQWASRPPLWAGSDNYRDFALGLELPLVALMALDAVHPRAAPATADGGPNWRLRSRVIAAAAVVFAAVVVVQSVQWNALTRGVVRQLEAAPGPCVDPASIGPRDTAAAHTTESLAIALQSRDVGKVVLNDNDCRVFAATGQLKLTIYDTEPVRNGWFHFPQP